MLPRVLLVAVALLLALEIATIDSGLAAWALVGIAVWIVVPGVALARALLGQDDGATVAAWLVGPALAFGLGVFGAFLWWWAGVRNGWALVLGPALPWLLRWLVRRYGAARLRLPRFDRRDVVAVGVVLLVVPAITWLPYDHVREPVAEGEAYRAYFTADFIWAMTVTAEIAKAEVPPQNPFLADQWLHYYWLAHFLSGATYRALHATGIRLETVVLVNGLLFGTAFVGFLYALIRSAGAGPAASGAAVGAAFLANSYEGADMIRAIVQHGQPWSDLADTNIDAVTRWFYKGMAVDGLQRLLLYQPHHLTGYVMGLAALCLVGLAEDVSETSVALGAGVLLMLSLLFSTFGALIIGTAVTLLYLLRLIQRRHRVMAAMQCAALGAVPVAVGVALTLTLGYVDLRYGSLLQFGVNQVAVHNAVTVWVLSFGPLLAGAVLSLLRWRWLLDEGAPAAALAVAAAAFYFFTNVPDSGDVWVGWRSGHLLLVAFAASSAALFTGLWQRRSSRWLVAVGTAGLVLPAIPTVAIDVFNAQDITNRREGPGFPWTMVVTAGERQALDWVRRSTPPHAVVQTEPHVRGAAQWSLIGACAERRSSAGLPGSMVPKRPYQEASDGLRRGVFEVHSAGESHAWARLYGVDYLFVGRQERRVHLGSIERMARAPHLFPVAFDNGEVTIFRVAPTGPGSAHHSRKDP